MINKQLSRLIKTCTVSLCCLGVFAPLQTFGAGAEKLSPAKLRQIKKNNKSFKDCQLAAVNDVKAKRLTQPGFKIALETCKERFPGASLYVDCKRQALKASPEAQASDLAECRKYMTTTAFDPDGSVPFFISKGQLYFAGVGMNVTLPSKALAPPNFECTKVTAALKTPNLAQYLLFGNEPRLFSGLANLSDSTLQKRLGIKLPTKKGKPKPTPKDGLQTRGYGKFYGDLRTGLTFFPVAACDFDGQLGDIYGGLTAYYLLDAQTSEATPYFGIAYYKPNQPTITPKGILAALREFLGEDMKIQRKNPHVQFISEQPLREFDLEKDPKNLCREPRSQPWVAVLQTLKDKPEQPEYLILANVKNLCDYGERLTRRGLK